MRVYAEGVYVRNCLDVALLTDASPHWPRWHHELTVRPQVINGSLATSAPSGPTRNRVRSHHSSHLTRDNYRAAPLQLSWGSSTLSSFLSSTRVLDETVQRLLLSKAQCLVQYLQAAAVECVPSVKPGVGYRNFGERQTFKSYKKNVSIFPYYGRLSVVHGA